MNKNQAQCIHGRVGICFHCATDLSTHRQRELSQHMAQAQAHQQDSGAGFQHRTGCLCAFCESQRECKGGLAIAKQEAAPHPAAGYEHFDAAVGTAAARREQEDERRSLRMLLADVKGERDRLLRERLLTEQRIEWLEHELVRLGGRKRGAR